MVCLICFKIFVGFLAWGITATLFLKLAVVIIVKIRITHNSPQPLDSSIDPGDQTPSRSSTPPQPSAPPEAAIDTPTPTTQTFVTPAQSAKPLIKTSPVSAHTRSKMRQKKLQFESKV